MEEHKDKKFEDLTDKQKENSEEGTILESKEGFYPFTHIFNNDNLILMQFTGLKDKNGKEIFEGDIVEVWDNQGATAILGQGKIVWNIEEVCFEVEYPKGNTEIIDNAIRMKIIGNIYENPELLNQRNESANKKIK